MSKNNEKWDRSGFNELIREDEQKIQDSKKGNSFKNNKDHKNNEKNQKSEFVDPNKKTLIQISNQNSNIPKNNNKNEFSEVTNNNNNTNYNNHYNNFKQRRKINFIENSQEKIKTEKSNEDTSNSNKPNINHNNFNNNANLSNNNNNYRKNYYQSRNNNTSNYLINFKDFDGKKKFHYDNNRNNKKFFQKNNQENDFHQKQIFNNFIPQPNFMNGPYMNVNMRNNNLINYQMKNCFLPNKNTVYPDNLASYNTVNPDDFQNSLQINQTDNNTITENQEATLQKKPFKIYLEELLKYNAKKDLSNNNLKLNNNNFHNFTPKDNSYRKTNSSTKDYATVDYDNNQSNDPQFPEDNKRESRYNNVENQGYGFNNNEVVNQNIIYNNLPSNYAYDHFYQTNGQNYMNNQAFIPSNNYIYNNYADHNLYPIYNQENYKNNNNNYFNYLNFPPSNNTNPDFERENYLKNNDINNSTMTTITTKTDQINTSAEKENKDLIEDDKENSNMNDKIINFENLPNQPRIEEEKINLIENKENSAKFEISEQEKYKSSAEDFILTVNIKINETTTKEFNIKKNDNIFQITKFFCQRNNLNEIILNSIYMKILTGLNTLNEIKDIKIEENVEKLINQAYNLYHNQVKNENNLYDSIDNVNKEENSSERKYTI